MDKNLLKALEDAIKYEMGDLVSKELKIRFQPLQEAINTVQKSNDEISRQIAEDRKDINQLRLDVSKISTGNKVIIDNQNHQEEAVIEAVKEEVQQIPKHTEKAVNKLFENKPLLKRIKERFK